MFSELLTYRLHAVRCSSRTTCAYNLVNVTRKKTKSWDFFHVTKSRPTFGCEVEDRLPEGSLLTVCGDQGSPAGGMKADEGAHSMAH